MYDEVIALPLKSLVAAILLAALLGPLGLFYATVAGGIVMLVLSAAGVGGMLLLHPELLPQRAVLLFPDYFAYWHSMVVLGAYLTVIWAICIIWSVVAVQTHNRMLLCTADD